MKLDQYLTFYKLIHIFLHWKFNLLCFIIYFADYYKLFYANHKQFYFFKSLDLQWNIELFIFLGIYMNSASINIFIRSLKFLGNFNSHLLLHIFSPKFSILELFHQLRLNILLLIIILKVILVLMKFCNIN